MEFILRFTFSNPDLDTTIVGTINPARLQTNLDILQKGPLPPDLYEEAKQRLAEAGSAPASKREYRRPAFPSLPGILGKGPLQNPQRSLALAAGTDHVSGPPSSESVFVEFSTCALASRLSASWIEATVTKVARVSARF